MNRNKLKTYAPQARRDFIQAVTDRAALYGMTSEGIGAVVEQGDVAIIDGRAYPKAIVAKRKKLAQRIEREGFDQTMEAVAYTWFNRLVAIRFMELHGYLEHGYRVLSNPDPSKTSPELLDHAEHVELSGLKRETVIELKLAGNKEAELYRLLLTAQCNALSKAMPFLFTKIDDETELLLPDNLLHSDSLIRKLVGEIDEEDWQEVEIIGWLYQFYISERKDEVIGKVVASEDIPAATQLFTPNWIVKYLVQNTLGRQWLATYPQSALRQQMEYYIEPAEQTPEVQEQLKAITPTSLNPEELTLLDPACGSGHILVEAYDLFKAIYQERGYRAKDIPALILQKNLFGLEIDDRSAQLAAFALMMKARADDRRIFDSEAKPNVVAIQESKGLNNEEIAYALNSPINKEEVPKEYLFEEIQEEKDGLFSKKALAEKGHVSQADIASLLELFENGKTFGSLIQIPPKLAAKLPEIEKRLADVLKFGDLTHASAHVLSPLLQQARLLVRQYDAVVANPPYLGSKGQNNVVKAFLKTAYPDTKLDTFAAFILRSRELVCQSGGVGIMCPFVWMFLSSYETLRRIVMDSSVITSLIQLEYSGFDGATVPICTFTLSANHVPRFVSSFVKLSAFRGAASQAPRTLEAIRNKKCGWLYLGRQDDFKSIPGSPIAFWSTEQVRLAFESMPQFSGFAETRIGLITGDNDRYLRRWWEVAIDRVGFGLTHEEAKASACRWFPVVKGGEFRKWYGNLSEVVNWQYDGNELQTELHPSGKRTLAHNFNLDKLFQQGINWSKITSSTFSARIQPSGCIFADPSASAFPATEECEALLLAFLASKVPDYLLKAINPTLNYQPGNIDVLPVAIEALQRNKTSISQITVNAISHAETDWNSCETSWDFVNLVLISGGSVAGLTARSMEGWNELCNARIRDMQAIEQNNNRIVIEAYGLQDELSPEVPDDQITLYRPDREEDIKRLLSYAIGCTMGRYSLDKPGLIYAHSGNQGFDASQYKTFRADDDGIIPLLETDWGIRDDAANRIIEFIGVAWPKEHLEENLKFVADSLGPNSGEQPRETIRRYLAASGTGGFYKHHLSMYKKRPIYWLFSSGKQRAFQCLVYLHRYHEGTLARMRNEYVIPLQGMLTSRIDQLATDISSASSTSHRKKLEKERDKLLKQQTELQAFDEKLRHYADQRITLDLDDGVKVNYGKFGDLLAEVKAICGTKDEE